MSRQTIRQPDGRYAIFSTIVDGFVCWDATREELIEFHLEEAAEKAEEMVRRECDALDAGTSTISRSWRLDWSEALAMHEAKYGPLDREDRGPSDVELLERAMERLDGCIVAMDMIGAEVAHVTQHLRNCYDSMDGKLHLLKGES